MLDVKAIFEGDNKVIDVAKDYSREDLRRESDESIDFLLDLLSDLDDADIVFNPKDPDADDPFAVEGQEHIGWNMGHLIAHVTASTEEGAAFSSILARGVEIGGRLRYETPWREMTTKAICVQRLEESRRIRNAYLDTWPDEPHLDALREMSERFEARFGKMNAPAAFLFGLAHEVGHYDQIKDVKEQALAAKQAQA